MNKLLFTALLSLLAVAFRHQRAVCRDMASMRCQPCSAKERRLYVHHNRSIKIYKNLSAVVARSSSYRSQFEEQPPRDAGEVSTSAPREDDVRPVAYYYEKVYRSS